MSRFTPIGYFLILRGLLERGDFRALDIELTGRGDIARALPELHESAPAHWFRCTRAILDGDTAAAEQLVDVAYAVATKLRHPDADAVRTAQLGVIRWMQGRIVDAEAGLLAARRAHPEQPVWAASLALLWFTGGRTSAAEGLLEPFLDLDSLPRNDSWLGTMTVLAEIAARFGPREFAQEVRLRLLPFARHGASFRTGLAFWGSTARPLGLLSERLGLIDEARGHLEFAIELARRVGAQAWLAEAQLELADFLARHDLMYGDETVRAQALLNEARCTATALGFAALERRAAEGLARLDPVIATARPHIRVLGGFEVVRADGFRAQWTSRKARELLKMLVSRRGRPTSREVFMEELWPGVHPRMLSNRFSVAVTTIRRALDPSRAHPVHHFVEVDGDTVRLVVENVDIDVEEFLAMARRTGEANQLEALALYRGDAFADEPYADWAEALRDEARTVFCDRANALGESKLSAGRHLAASHHFHSVLAVDPRNLRAMEGLIDALDAMGTVAHADRLRDRLDGWESEARHTVHPAAQGPGRLELLTSTGAPHATG